MSNHRATIHHTQFRTAHPIRFSMAVECDQLRAEFLRTIFIALCAEHLRTIQLRLRNTNCSGEVKTTNHRAGEIGIREVGAGNDCASEVCTTQICTREIGIRQIGANKRGLLQVGAYKFGTLQIGHAEIDEFKLQQRIVSAH